MKFQFIKTIASSLIFLGLLGHLLIADTREFEGTVSKKDGDNLTIKFESDWAPTVGDPVTISTNIAGRVVSGGKAEITEVGDGWVQAKVLSGKPNIRMQALIVSKNPVPINLDAETAFTEGLTLYREAVPEGKDYLSWNSRVDSKSDSYRSAIPLLKLAAEQNHPEANYLYAKHFFIENYSLELYTNNEPQPENPWLQKAVDLNFPAALFVLGKNYNLGFGVEKDKDKAQSYLKRAADQGHLEAMLELSMHAKDITSSRNYRIKAAEGGLRRAQEMLGHNFMQFPDGKGFAPYNLEQAIFWLSKAIKQGSSVSMFRLAELYFHGGVHFPIHEIELKNFARMGGNMEEIRRHFESRKMKQDLQKAKEFYQQAVEADVFMYDPFLRLAQLHSTRGTDFFNESEAFAWYEKGAEKNKVYSILGLAHCYRLGIGTETDHDKAYQLATRAHDGWSNIDQTKIELALCYRDGIGTQVDYNKAVELLTPIIEKDYKPSYEAMVHLGDMYRSGQGFPQDYSRALYWYQTALEAKPSSGPHENNEKIKAMAYARIARAYAYGEGRDKQMNVVFENSSAALRLDPHQPLALRCGGLFLNSFREKENKLKAAQAFERAANLGDIESYFLLADMYARGSGVKRDKDTAIVYYRTAAQAGHEKSQAALRKLKVNW